MTGWDCGVPSAHWVCLDNAVTESLFATLKVKLIDRQHHRTRAEARASIFRCGGERVTDHLPVPWDRSVVAGR
ncbi:MAG TPA: hypothetical protein VFH49_14320 [Aquabacterium sp.]|nr:hypothetical protein [Aquabacterium sp.]